MYLCVPAYGPNGPKDARVSIDLTRQLAQRLGDELVVSPLVSRYLGRGQRHSLQTRLDDLAQALTHRYIVAFRGGYGSIELAEGLLQMPVPADHKPVLFGYSDITVLHAVWQVRNWGQTFYGPMPDKWEDSRTARDLMAMISGQSLTITSDTEAMTQVLAPGHAKGPCFAACLTVLSHLVGTPAMPDLRGRVLAIEDIDEKPWQVDCALAQLHLSGSLGGVVAIVGGQFPHTNHADFMGNTCLQVLAHWAERLKVPCITRLPFSHLDDQMGLMNGRELELDAQAEGRWSITWTEREPLARHG